MSEQLPPSGQSEIDPHRITRQLFGTVAAAWREADLAPQTLEFNQLEPFAAITHHAMQDFLTDPARMPQRARLVPNSARVDGLLHDYHAAYPHRARPDAIIERRRQQFLETHINIARSHALTFPQVAYANNLQVIFAKHRQPIPALALSELLAAYGVLLKPLPKARVMRPINY